MRVEDFISEYGNWRAKLRGISKIRCQLAEQLRCLEARTETQTAILSELGDYYRRRAEIDSEYGRQLEKLAKSTMQRHKNEKSKRESWPLHSSCALWQQLVDSTKEEAREKRALAELYSSHFTTLIARRSDDLLRISRKCREIGILAHGEITRVLNELHTAMKTYQLCFAQCSAVESKYRQAEANKSKYEEENPSKRGSARRHRVLVKLVEKRLEKYKIVKVKCLKARNEYLLCVGAANAALHKYFADDLSDLIDCADLGMQQWERALISCAISARKSICQREMDSLAELCDFKDSLDTKADKQRFFEANYTTFMLPRRFEFRGQVGDAISVVSAEEGVAEELQQRHVQIDRRLGNVRQESEEIWKTLESTERAVVEKHLDSIPNIKSITALIGTLKSNASDNTSDTLKGKHDLNELYDYYLAKFSHYLLNSNLIERLEARSNGILNALNEFSTKNSSEGGADVGSNADTPTPSSMDSENINLRVRKKKRIGSGTASCEVVRRPRLFGGSLDEYVEATSEAIPLLITSSIRVLSQFALHHQGIFRISGSQIEINAFKEAFEKGEDPLRDVVDASDVNSVAGVLKLYLRELREPLFPIFLFDQLTKCAECPTAEGFIQQIVPLLQKLSQPTLLVLRYLFAFLNHLSEFSDENMMDPYNLAICFGPTLLPIPEGKDQVFYHNFVNELVKNLILYHDQVFPQNLPGPRYEKYLVETDHALFIDEPDEALSGDEEGPSATLSKSVIEEPSSPVNDISQTSGSCSSRACSEMKCVSSSGDASPPETPCSDDTPMASTSYLYSSIIHYKPDLKDTQPATDLSPTQPQPVSQRASSLCSTSSSTRSARSTGYFESAYLFRRYGSEDCNSPDSAERTYSVANSNSAQIWSRRAAGASSLREQLHHTRNKALRDSAEEKR
ncbi:unnamed protein product [Enterobius vermicularis]|uniref:F-BAR domain-containing protein n=1 Tax=Enterobius vermicularis TaxID=51028 RepID=A0A158QAP1_ENTVE|nr:unnamed protein product [Enterobius vermicularis]